MTSKIIDYVILDDEQNPLLDAEGFPTLVQAPIGKDIGWLVEAGKISHIETFAKLTSDIEQHEWAGEYLEYLKLLAEVNEYNANLPEPIENDDGTTTEAEPKPLPTEPLRPEVRTVEQVLEPYKHKIAKLRGIEFKGMDISLSESNQNGLSALKSALDLAIEFDAGDKFFPIKFNAETLTGNQVVELVDEVEFKQFGLQFIMARKAYFE